MALRQIRIGSSENIVQYDDGDFDKSISVEDPIDCSAAPIAANDLVRLDDMTDIFHAPIQSVNLASPTELNAVAGKEGALIIAYKVNAMATQDEWTIYAYDASGPAVNMPYVVDALGGGDERWIAIGGEYSVFTTLAPVGTKNPPIDADKVIYRDSTASDVLVTSTWAQVKAFLKTYFDTLYGTLGSAHAQLHSIISTSDHSSTATSGQMLKADANGLPIDATNTDAAVAGAVSASHGVNDVNTSSEPSGATATHSALTTGVHGVGAGTVAKVSDIASDGNLSAAAQSVVTAGPCDVDANLSAAAQAVVTAGACDVDANLSVAAQAVITAGACDTDANLSVAAQAAISASHAQAHTVASHSDANLGGISNSDLMQWDDASSKWLPKSIAEVILSQSISPGPITISTVEDWRYAAAIADDGTKELPTIAANYAAKVEVIISSAGIIDANATFMIDSTGTVTPQVDSGNCVYNIDTDVKLCIGTAAAQNPLTIKYRLGSAAAKIMITMMYVKA